jgi:hypothetical protein
LKLKKKIKTEDGNNNAGRAKCGYCGAVVHDLLMHIRVRTLSNFD